MKSPLGKIALLALLAAIGLAWARRQRSLRAARARRAGSASAFFVRPGRPGINPGALPAATAASIPPTETGVSRIPAVRFDRLIRAKGSARSVPIRPQ